MNKSETIAIIRSLLSSTNSSYSIFKLNVDFKNETGVEIPLHGHANIADFLHSIPDTVKVTGIYPVQRVSLVTNEKSGHIVSLVKRQKNSGQKHGNKNKKTFSKNKSFSRKAALDVRGDIFQKPQTIFIKNSTDSSSEKIFSKDETSESNIVPRKMDISLHMDSTSRFIPLKNCVSLEDSIPHVNIELHAQVGRYVEINVCHIFSPHKFYFHLREYKKIFSNFEEKLQIFYTIHDFIEVSDEEIRPKLICAVFCNIHKESMWHRAEICEVVKGSQVKVNLIDYGVVVKICKKNMKYLHRDFMSLPRQAFLGSLANIRPSGKNSDWSPAAIKKFFDLTIRKNLVAGVVHIDTKENCMKAALSSTRGLEIHINDTLVKEGFAEFDMNIANSPETSNAKDCNKNKFVNNEVMNYNEEFREDILKSLQVTIPQDLPKPVFYFSDTYSNNNRLKKMFSYTYKN